MCLVKSGVGNAISFPGPFLHSAELFPQSSVQNRIFNLHVIGGKNRGFVNEIECNFAGESWRSMRYC